MEELIKTPFDEEIETERLILKRHQLTFEYANIFFNLIKENQEFLTKFLHKMASMNKPEDEYIYLIKANEAFKNADSAEYAIFTKENHLIGSCGVPQIDYETKQAEIGYFLFKQYTGCGYMTEAVKAIEENFFNRGFNRLTIVMDTENAPSENVAVRCGYKKEGVMREWQYNLVLQSWRDMNLYAKLKSEWEKQR